MNHNTPVTEAELKAKAVAPRVTEKELEANIKSIEYVDGIGGRLTFCILTLQNGFLVMGESACVSPENFDQEIGRRYAYQQAYDKIWALMGYELRERLHRDQMRAVEDGEIVANGELRITLTIPKDVKETHTHILAGSFAGCREQLQAAIDTLIAERDAMDGCPAHAVVRGPASDNAAPAPGFSRYRSHKIVEAAEIVRLQDHARGPLVTVHLAGGHSQEVGEIVFTRGRPHTGDFLVIYDDGYVSWSPRDKFLDGYTRIGED
jgi:hypothetical protein